ncbi:MAG: DNA/RNA non-specific endonuclease, partial [Prevotella sp.]|nr:DNA/RNA non-specific endonuclease [Prevotella sp.]
YAAVGIWSPHAGGSITEYITIDELENRTGIDFFCNLPDGIEAYVEQTVDTNRWK